MERVVKIMDSMLKLDFVELSFSDISVYRHDEEVMKEKKFQEQMETFFNSQTTESKEAALLIYISKCDRANSTQLQLFFNTLDLLVKRNVLGARVVCEQILSCEKLDFKNELFFVEGFKLIKRLIGGVDYKGVREIMKGCREKANSFPVEFSTSILPQLMSVHDVLKYIFDRNACLLPAYFIITELQKQENAGVHWKISTLTTTFIEEFVNLAQMLTIIGHSSMYPILEPASAAGYGEATNPWRLDPNTLKFTTLKGNLPYDSELTQPQIGLLRYVLQQLYSKEMVCSMLNLQKQRSAVLEEQIVWLVILAMERSEQELSANETKNDPNDSTPTHNQWLWLHLSSQLIYFVLFQCAAFPNIINALHEKLATMSLRKGRDDLCWALLQYISGSIQRNALSNFLPVLKLYDILYNEKEPLPVPDVKLSSSTKKIAATCIYIHLLKKAQLENVALRPIPIALKKHYEFLQHLSSAQNQSLSIGEDYVVTLLCNAYSTNQEYFSRPMGALIDTILMTNKPPTQSVQLQPAAAQSPISMVVLDSLTVHSKMSVIHCIVNNMMKQAETKSTMPNMSPNISPALVETYSRLLVYTEIESLGIKGFLSRLLPTVCKSNAWSILYTLLEMFSYRLFHIQAHYRAQLLTQLHTLSQNSHINQPQLHLCFESTALRLLTGLGSAEFQFQLSRFLTEPKNLASMVSSDSEELNRVLVLTLSRSMIITGMENETTGNGNLAYLMDLLQVIMKNTPHNWPSHTKQSFPKVLSDFYATHNLTVEDKQQVKKSIEEEYRNWLSMTNENDIIAYFSQTTTFLCLLFKMISDTGEPSPVAYKILERISARLFSSNLRKLCDFLLYEVTISKQITKLVDTINDMIWKYNFVTIDRLVLCLALRTQEPNHQDMPTAQVFVIQLLLIKTTQFRDRVIKFVEKNSPEYWKLSNYNEKHLAFEKEFPEKFVPSEEHYSTFFGNVCLRFLPVLDIVIHRYLEMSIDAVAQPLESVLKMLGLLYKFHDRPITYLYNTLFYYELKLRDRPALKRLLVGAIITSLKDVREKNWALTEQYQNYIKNHMTPDDPAQGQMSQTTVKWSPDLSYYMGLVKRLIETIEGKNVFPNVDWRFNEFPNPPTHALYVTCVELLGLPSSSPQAVSNNIIDVALKGLVIITYQHIHSWLNSIGLIISALPEPYWNVIYDRLEEIIKDPQMTEWTYRQSPFDMFSFRTVQQALLETKFVMILALAHSIFHHFNIGQTSKMVFYIREKLVPHIKTEYQLIYLHHILGPFLQRLDPKDVIEITKIYYELLEQLDKNKSQTNEPIQFMDPICDMLYHIKYMFVGDSMKADLEPIIRRLSNPLRLRLRFITRLSVEDIKAEKNEFAGIKAQNQPLQPQKINRI